jgi:hypothetical protein
VLSALGKAEEACGPIEAATGPVSASAIPRSPWSPRCHEGGAQEPPGVHLTVVEALSPALVGALSGTVDLALAYNSRDPAWRSVAA